MILYAVNLRPYDFGAIKEYEVVRETEKTYVIRDYGERTVKKSDMINYAEYFFTDKEEAKSYSISSIKKKIEEHERRILKLKEQLEKVSSLA